MRLALLCLLMLTPAMALASATLPTDPTPVSISVNPVPISTTSTLTTIAQVEAAVAAATCGTKIVISSTADLTPTGNYILLPNVVADCTGVGTAGVSAISGSSGVHAVSGSSGVSATSAVLDNYMTITTSGSLPASGTRVSTSDAANMPTIRIPPAGSAAFLCADGAHHWRIVGIHMKPPAGQLGTAGVICQGPNVDSNINNQVSHISIERSIVEGDSTNGMSNGVQAIGAHVQIVDSLIGKNVFRLDNTETHAIMATGGTGPYKFSNNEIEDSSISMFLGDSQVHNAGVIPADFTIEDNYIHKSLSFVNTAAPGSGWKNEFECKHCERVKLNRNKFYHAIHASQHQAVSLCSTRGNGGRCRDISFTNNYVRDAATALVITTRPSLSESISTIAGDGTTNCSGGPCVKVTMSAACDCTTGNTIEIQGATGTTEANGQNTITVIDSTHLTIPVPFVHAYTGGAYAQMYMSGAPSQRINIANNVFEDMTSLASQGVGGVLDKTIDMNVNPVLTPVGDVGQSSVGHWRPDDFRFVNNTFVSPSTQPDAQFQWWNLTLAGSATSGVTYANTWQGQNWEITNNLVKMSSGPSGGVILTTYAFIQYDPQSGGSRSNGTTALNFVSDSATRTWNKNAFYLTANTPADEYGILTGTEAYPASVVLTDHTNIGYTSHTTGNPTNFALANLYTWSNCSASSASAVVTCSGATIPTTVMKGTPFKVDSDGNFGVVLSRDSATQVTLQANYHATVSGQSTFGFKGYGVGGVDIGANTALVAQ